MTFEEWMRQHHYSAATIKQTIVDLKRAGLGRAHNDQNVTNALRRYVTFANEAQIEDSLTEVAAGLGIGRVKRLPQESQPRRKHDAVSFEEADWSHLRDVVAGSADPRDQVIWAMVTTGLRVGDVLRVSRDVLQLLLQTPGTLVLHVEVKGGQFRPVPLSGSEASEEQPLAEPWLALARGVVAARARNVATYVCPSNGEMIRGGCAYKRVDRRLKALQRKLQLSGRVHAHRIRRTIAVKALGATEDLVKVQQLLGHRSLKSTMKYVDEARVKLTGDLMMRIAGPKK